jgi:hypothetical protein
MAGGADPITALLCLDEPVACRTYLETDR